MKEGVYNGDIILDREITLMAAKAHTVTIQGKIRCKAGTSLSGFIIKNVNKVSIVVEEGISF